MFFLLSMPRRLFTFCLLLWAASLYARQFVMLPLPNQLALPQSEVYRVFEDSEGYMWYATRGAGLCRDNGYQIDVFRSDRNNPNLLRSNAVTCIAENVEQHEIWFGTKQGGYVLSKRDYQVRPIEGMDSHVHAILQTSDGSMWVAARKQVKVFSAKGEPEDSFALSWKGRPMTVERMTLDSHGTLWLMQWDGGVQTIDTHTRQLTTMNWEEPTGPTSLAEDTLHHQMFVGTWGSGLFRYDGQHAQPLAPELTTYMQRCVRSVHYDGWRQMLWVVTMAGLYAYTIDDDGELSPLSISHLGLTPQQAVFPLCFDRQGNVWVPATTPLTFILRSTGGKWMKRLPLDQLTKQAGVQVPIDAFQTEGDYCWMWSDRTQLVLYNRATERLTLAHGAPDQGTTRFGDVMERSRTGGIWCATGRRLYKCTHADMTVQLEPVLRMDKTIASLCETPDGLLYIGSADGLYRYAPRQGTLDTVATGMRTVRDIVAGPQGRMFFISVSEGLCCATGPKGYKVLAPYQRFTSLACDGAGRLWVANAYGDVWQLADSILRHVPVASNPNSNGVKQLLTDTLGHLWVMGDTYLVEYHPESDRRRLFRNSDYGIGTDNYGGMALTDDGQVLVAGCGGMMLFEPKNIGSAGEPLRPAVASYAVNGKKRLLSSLCKKIEVPADVVTLDMELTAFQYLKARNVQFAYRLKGLNGQWRELPLGVNTLQLVNLPKGDYVMELKVCDGYAHWGEPVEALTISRLPAWYESWLAYACYLAIAAGALAWAVRTYLRRSKLKTQRQMEDRLAEMKLRFFTNMSHELRTPLSLIITPLESIIRRGEAEQPSKEREQLKGILKHANHLLDLVNRLLDFRKLDMGEMRLHPATGDIHEFLRTCVASFQPIATAKELSLHADVPDVPLYADFDAQALQHVMFNLLSNAVKYTAAGGSVSLAANVVADNRLRIVVADTGSGIAPEELPHIFDRYYQAANAREGMATGSGIGLNMVRDIVELMQGTVGVTSQVGQGTTFTLELPLLLHTDSEDLPTTPVIPKLPSLLIADDNDDFRDFLVQELSSDYNIIQARNGKEALRMAQTHYVDVILSDVMMPQMDGYELCRQLKHSETTSHIYVILLTARAAQQSMMEGYEAGADYYLTKPFSMDLLRNRLQHLVNLQQQRILMLSKGSGTASEQPSEEDLRISPVDRRFMQKLKTVMERYVADSDFSVDVFCSEMGLSRMNLYRKMHALTGKTPAQFINDYRLDLADRLLREGELNVSEVADRIGYASASYFSKSYKAKFGISPNDVRPR